MDKGVLVHLAKTINILTNIPTHIYDEENDKAVETFQTVGEFSNDEGINEQLRLKYQNIVKLSEGQNFGYYISDDLVGIGKVRDINSSFSMIVGGCKLADINKYAANNMLLNAKNAMEVPDTTSKDKFFSYMQRFPRVTPHYFLWLLSLINTIINREIVDVTEFVSQSPLFNNPDKQTDNIFIKKREFSGGEDDGKEKINSEKLLVSYVKNGDIKGVKKYWNDVARKFNWSSTVYVSDTLRQTKNNFITLVTVISRATIEEGVSENLACTLADSYIVRAEGCLSIEEFSNFVPAMLGEFTEKVKELKESTNDDNYIVKRAIAYINDHITEKIMIADISSALKISGGYLSSLFKKSTDMYITDFINKQKILESRRLLDNTGMTLSEITNHFSFSSQSYYQNLFKKYIGVTPTEYRKKKNK